MTPKRTDEEVLRVLEMDDELSEDYPMELVDKALKAAGGDPAAIAARGACFVEALRKAQRLAWQEEAREKIRSMKAFQEGRIARDSTKQLTRDELLHRLERAKSDPRLGGQLSFAARNMELVSKSDDALREELDQIELLAEMGEALEKGK